MTRATSTTLSGTSRPAPGRRRPDDPGRYPLEAVVLLVVALMVSGSAVAVAAVLGPLASSPAVAPAPRTGLAGAASSLVTIEAVTGAGERLRAGTGIVLSSGGRVVTNHHVVVGATRIEVTSAVDGVSHQAAVVGYEAAADVAVLQLVGAADLPVARLGDPRGLAVGDPVSVLGDAGGRGRITAAAGRVTALDRSVTTVGAAGAASSLGDLIEVDARAAPGVSGGALVAPDGTVLGMTSAGESSVDAAGPTGFAIPIDDVTTSVARILAGDRSAGVHVGPSASLGVQPAPGGSLVVPTPTGDTTGLLVDSSTPGSPAAAVGLGPGDVVTALDGAAVRSQASLAAVLSAHRPGDEVTLSWTDVRGSPHRAVVTLAEGAVG